MSGWSSAPVTTGILSDEFLGAFPDAILNVHPSLLPAFGGGMHAVEDALEHGVKISGCTVQLLEPGITDGGPIILQRAVPVHEDDDAAEPAGAHPRAGVGRGPGGGEAVVRGTGSAGRVAWCGSPRAAARRTLRPLRQSSLT